MKFEISKIKNFVFLLYIVNKEHKGLIAWKEARDFLIGYKLDDCRTKVLPYLITLPDKTILSVLSTDETFKKIYEGNFDKFSDYFDKHEKLLQDRKKELGKFWEQYDKTRLDALYKFYNSKKTEPKKVHLFLGNFHNQGLGYAYMAEVLLFCADLGKDGAQRDFRVLLHEFCHLLEKSLQLGDNKKLMQEIAFCFAPYGYLSEDLNQIQNKELYQFIKETINKGLTFKDIRLQIEKFGISGNKY